MDSKITLQVISEDGTLISKEVHLLDPVEIIYDSETDQIVWNSISLSPSFSFSFYGIANGDRLFSFHKQAKPILETKYDALLPDDLRKQYHDNFMQRWGIHIHDADEVFDEIMGTFDPATRDQTARIHDLQSTQAQNYTRFGAKLGEIRLVQSRSIPKHPTVIPLKPMRPSDSVLPLPWSSAS